MPRSTIRSAPPTVSPPAPHAQPAARPRALDAAARDRWVADAERRVRHAGLRPGPVRSAVIALLAEDGRCMLTAHEITALLRERGVGSPASVYRVLDELHDLALLVRLDGPGGVARYEIRDARAHHHHVVDERGGQVTAFRDDRLDALIAEIADRLGVRLTSHEVVLRGHAAADRRPRAADDAFALAGTHNHDAFPRYGGRERRPPAA